MHRQRLVGLSQSLKARGRRDIDAAITAWVQCSKSRCIEQAERYGVANRTNPFKYRYGLPRWMYPRRQLGTTTSKPTVNWTFRRWGCIS